MKDLIIEVFNSLPPDIKQQTDDLRYRAFHKEKLTKEQKKENEEKYIFEEASFRFVIAFLKDKPVGYIRLFKRLIHFNKHEILLGGIGGVCTDPQYQRHGIATKMLQRAIEELRKENCDMAYLCTDTSKLGTLYKQVGFKKMEKQFTFTGKSGKRYYQWDGMIAPINSKEIFKEILESSELLDLEGQNW